MQRVPVISTQGYPLMLTKPSRARRWLKNGKAVIWKNKLKVFAIQLTIDSDCDTQPVVVGIDPGKLFTGIAIQSKQCTHWLGHLYLPFQKIKDRLEQRRMMRRGRRGRRINKAALRGKLPPQTCRRNIPFNQRAHRQKRFDNRRSKKIPPSIKANRDLEYRVLDLLSNIFPLRMVVIETVKARGDKAFSPVMVAQKWQFNRLWEDYMVRVKEGWETAQLRTQLGLKKQKNNKADAVIETHAVDGIALACSEFVKYRRTSLNSRGWVGEVNITPCRLTVIRRPPISRRQLHLMVPSTGNKRRKYGGTVTRHGLRKGDFVEATQGKKTVRGWVSGEPVGGVGFRPAKLVNPKGDTKTQVSVSDANWKRLGQFSKNKVWLIHRSISLIVTGG